MLNCVKEDAGSPCAPHPQGQAPEAPLVSTGVKGQLLCGSSREESRSSACSVDGYGCPMPGESSITRASDGMLKNKF